MDSPQRNRTLGSGVTWLGHMVGLAVAVTFAGWVALVVQNAALSYNTETLRREIIANREDIQQLETTVHKLLAEQTKLKQKVEEKAK